MTTDGTMKEIISDELLLTNLPYKCTGRESDLPSSNRIPLEIGMEDQSRSEYYP